MTFPVSGVSRIFPAVQQITQGTPFPAPSLGINGADNLAEMDPRESIYAYNILPQQYGLRVRTGYREYATSIGTDGGRTIIPYKGSLEAADKLFACAEDGIYDISAGGVIGAAEVTFVDQDTTSGYGQSVAFTTTAGHFQCYCDETNGYYLYDEDLDTWTKVAFGVGAGEVSVVDPADLVAVCAHKGRLWFVERDSSRAWYLAPGAVTGAATVFNFGTRFKVGGFLVNLYNWTVDGGEGVDDYLVGISSSGDVVSFRGEDPSDATAWFLRGVWSIGRPPAGRRVAGSFGGELYLLSSFGVLPITKLISGVLIQEESTYISKKIAPFIRTRMQQTANDLGWEIVAIPSENILLVAVPDIAEITQIQFAYSLNSQGWGFYREFPYFTGVEWNGDFYFSDADGVVQIHAGSTDAVPLDASTFEPVRFSLLTSFQNLNPSEAYKRLQFIKPIFLAGGTPSYEVVSRYDYDLTEPNGFVTPATQLGTLWDVGIWDVGLWSGGYIVSQTPSGGTGMGVAIAVALRGETTFETTLVKFTAMYDAGNLL